MADRISSFYGKSVLFKECLLQVKFTVKNGNIQEKSPAGPEEKRVSIPENNMCCFGYLARMRNHL
jgi:hypothetical protein